MQRRLCHCSWIWCTKLHRSFLHPDVNKKKNGWGKCQISSVIVYSVIFTHGIKPKLVELKRERGNFSLWHSCNFSNLALNRQETKTKRTNNFDNSHVDVYVRLSVFIMHVQTVQRINIYPYIEYMIVQIEKKKTSIYIILIWILIRVSCIKCVVFLVVYVWDFERTILSRLVRHQYIVKILCAVWTSIWILDAQPNLGSPLCY